MEILWGFMKGKDVLGDLVVTQGDKVTEWQSHWNVGSWHHNHLVGKQFSHHLWLILSSWMQCVYERLPLSVSIRSPIVCPRLRGQGECFYWSDGSLGMTRAATPPLGKAIQSWREWKFIIPGRPGSWQSSRWFRSSKPRRSEVNQRLGQCRLGSGKRN